jgi:hypothetical protein
MEDFFPFGAAEKKKEFPDLLQQALDRKIFQFCSYYCQIFKPQGLKTAFSQLCF